MNVLANEAGSVVTAITTAVTSAASDAMSAISGVLPVALPIMGAMVVVGIGIAVFRKATGNKG